MKTRQDGGKKDEYFYNLGKYVGSTGGIAEPPILDSRTGLPATIDQLMSWEDGMAAGVYEYNQAHGGEPEGSGGGIG